MARLLLLLAVAACGDVRSTGGAATSSSSNAPASSSPPDVTASSETTPTAAPAASASSSGTASASATPTVARPIAAWLDEAEAKVGAWAREPFAIEGVYQRTWLYQSGVYVGDEHPGIRVFVVNVADAIDAAPGNTLQCWTKLLAMPTDLKEGDRVRVEGSVSHLSGHGGRRYLPHLSECKYTRL